MEEQNTLEVNWSQLMRGSWGKLEPSSYSNIHGKLYVCAWIRLFPLFDMSSLLIRHPIQHEKPINDEFGHLLNARYASFSSISRNIIYSWRQWTLKQASFTSTRSENSCVSGTKKCIESTEQEKIFNYRRPPHVIHMW